MYAFVKDIYRLAEAFAGMKRMEGSSRKGLSPLLAIIIGLVVTVVAGILLAQLYFSYAATISKRPAANIEYIDLVTSDGSGVLVVNVKNMGDVAITGITVANSDGNPVNECDSPSNIPPGGTGSVSCTGIPANPGDVWSGYVNITFADNSSQSYAISVRARSA